MTIDSESPIYEFEYGAKRINAWIVLVLFSGMGGTFAFLGYKTNYDLAQFGGGAFALLGIVLFLISWKKRYIKFFSNKISAYCSGTSFSKVEIEFKQVGEILFDDYMGFERVFIFNTVCAKIEITSIQVGGADNFKRLRNILKENETEFVASKEDCKDFDLLSKAFGVNK